MQYLKIILLLGFLTYISACEPNVKKEISKSDSTKPADSLALINLAINKDPSNSANYLLRANYYLNRRQYDKALNDINVCLASDSTNPNLLMVKINIYFFGKDIDAANKTLKKSLIYNGGHLETLLKNAEFQFYLQKYNEAAASINEAVRIDPNNAKSYFIRGMIYKEKGDTMTAISSFITATEQNPEYFDAHMQLGTIQSAKNAPAAGKYFQNALRINAKSDEAWVAFGLFLQRNNPNMKLAKDAYKNAIKMNPNNTNAHYNLGAICFVEKEYLDASKHFSDALFSDSLFYNAYYSRALCYKNLRYKAEAKKDFQNYLRFAPEDKDAIANLKNL